MNIEYRTNYIMDRNRFKWCVLPAGKERKNVKELLKLSDSQLLSEYKGFIEFWESERAWEYNTYSQLFQDKDVLEIGSGLGYDGIFYSNYVTTWTYSDIIQENVLFLKRLIKIFNKKNIKIEYVEDIISHQFPDRYDALYAHGVLHHIPFELAQLEVKNIDKFLKSKAKVVCLMYPKERWEYCGCPDFQDFGKMTDGENTPWAEWYDEEKIQRLFGNNYTLLSSKRWGWNNIEFINFLLEKNNS